MRIMYRKWQDSSVTLYISRKTSEHSCLYSQQFVRNNRNKTKIGIYYILNFCCLHQFFYIWFSISSNFWDYRGRQNLDTYEQDFENSEKYSISFWNFPRIFVIIRNDKTTYVQIAFRRIQWRRQFSYILTIFVL